MPANEQTWRNPRLMHTVFAVSSVLMLLTTIWMMADDHNRPWKDYQRKFINLDSWTTAARITDAETAEYKATLDKLQAKLKSAQETFTPADQQNVAQFLRLDKQYAEEFAALVKQYNKDFAVTWDERTAVECLNLSQSLVALKEPQEIRASRAKLLEQMKALLARAQFREDHFTQETKEKRADFSAAQSQFDQAVGQARPPEELKKRQQAVDAANAAVDISFKLTSRAIEQRKGLEIVLKQVTAAEDKAQKDLDDHQQKVKQLNQTLKERSLNWQKDVLTMPILDGFNGPLKDVNRWLPQLPWNVNFKQVARFDRCETCHMGMDRGLPGEPTKPGFPAIHPETLEIATPAKPPVPGKDGAQPTLETVYGFRLAESGVFNPNDVAVSAVYPLTPAAVAGLAAGDVIEFIGDAHVLRPDQVRGYMLDNVAWGKPLTLHVERGVPHPYASHPRLELFVGSVSPHPVDKFGCTICHQGQGSETAFNWATHTPNTIEDGKQWTLDHQWFENENWTLPMFPKRFAESGCLKCHHEVVDLESSRKFPDAPAPKLVTGYETIRRYGCFGCHEINGYAGTQRIGPDLRLEPNYFAAAAELQVDPGLAKLSPDAPALAEEVAVYPDHDTARRRLHELVLEDSQAKQPLLNPQSLRMETVLRDADLPGTIRKVGPSLRHVKSKVGFEFLTSWIGKPKNFRPDTRMPQFFSLWEHLDPGSRGLAEAQKMEPVEIRAIAEYLLNASQPFDYLEPPAGLTPADQLGDAERAAAVVRGKKVFQTRGCLACHQHADFNSPLAKQTQGPDLSRIGAKLATTPNGRKWLYSWVRQPNRYHLRTAMPNLFLEPVTDAKGVKTDPADDVTEYLMTSQQGWKPVGALNATMTPADESALDDLALQFLSEKFPKDRASEYLRDGIPAALGETVQGDESVFVQGKDEYTAAVAKATPNPENPLEAPEHKQRRQAREMEYVGRRAIGKYGCFACHDIPGYEDAKPIGTALADWGRKDPSRLAFEQIEEYLTHHQQTLLPPPPEAKPAATTDHAAHSVPGSSAAGSNAEQEAAAEDITLDQLVDRLPTDAAYFVGRILKEDRIGFLWQKLRAPRSYDYKKTEEKKYNERLRMPQFTFAVDRADQQAKLEAVMTFVLGLVADPPPADYVARPQGPSAAIVAGRKVLEQFNCAGCHMLEMERWDIAYHAADFGKPPSGGGPDYPFLAAHFTPPEMEQAKKLDRRGLMQATLTGLPLISAKDGSPIRVDEDGAPIEPGDTSSKAFDPFMLFDNVVVDGAPRLIGAQNLRVPETTVVRKYPSRGGDLAKFLFPVVVSDEAAITPAVKDKPNESWGWLPPSLAGEGRKVQTEWLHDFLLDPFPIRPAVVLRMPKFNMSSAEASTLVQYFTAMDSAEFPYEFDPRSGADHFEAMETKHPHYLESALGIVTDNNYCIKCHLVGDFSPTGSLRAMAPRLDRVHARLRPEYLHRWVANPVRTIPYTGMPVNIPVDKPVDQKLFPGTSEQQLNAVVDLLMNFDRLALNQMSIKSRIKPVAPAAAPGAAPAGQPPAAAPANSVPGEVRSADAAPPAVGRKQADGSG